MVLAVLLLSEGEIETRQKKKQRNCRFNGLIRLVRLKRAHFQARSAIYLVNGSILRIIYNIQNVHTYILAISSDAKTEIHNTLLRRQAVKRDSK